MSQTVRSVYYCMLPDLLIKLTPRLSSPLRQAGRQLKSPSLQSEDLQGRGTRGWAPEQSNQTNKTTWDKAPRVNGNSLKGILAPRIYQEEYEDKSWTKQGLPWWLRGKESACQCRRHEFDPWSRKIPQAAEQLSNYWARAPEPRIRNKTGHLDEKPAHHHSAGPAPSSWRKACTATKSQHSQKPINKKQLDKTGDVKIVSKKEPVLHCVSRRGCWGRVLHGGLEEGEGTGKGARCLGIRGTHWGLEAETCHTWTTAVSPETLKPEMWMIKRSMPTCSSRYYRAVELD